MAAHHVCVPKHGVHGPRRLHRRLRLAAVSAVWQPQGAQEARGGVENVDERRRRRQGRKRVRQPAQRHLPACVVDNNSCWLRIGSMQACTSPFL